MTSEAGDHHSIQIVLRSSLQNDIGIVSITSDQTAGFSSVLLNQEAIGTTCDDDITIVELAAAVNHQQTPMV
nr:hypothetical protein [Microbulbifer sp. Q7]